MLNVGARELGELVLLEQILTEAVIHLSTTTSNICLVSILALQVLDEPFLVLILQAFRRISSQVAAAILHYKGVRAQSELLIILTAPVHHGEVLRVQSLRMLLLGELEACHFDCH